MSKRSHIYQNGQGPYINRVLVRINITAEISIAYTLDAYSAHALNNIRQISLADVSYKTPSLSLQTNICLDF